MTDLALTSPDPVQRQATLERAVTQYMQYFTSGSRILHGWTPPARRADDDVRAAAGLAVGRAIQGLNNSGFLQGALDVAIGLMVGDGLALNATPNAQALGWSEERARSWASEAERRWAMWATRPLECDAAGKQSIGQMCTTGLRAWFAHGEILATLESKRHPGAVSRTKVQLLDPLTLPRSGVNVVARDSIETDPHGLPLAYLFRVKDEKTNVETDRRVMARTNTGRELVVHIFDGRPGQRRGITVFAPALRVVRQFDQLADATLAASLLQTIYAATIKSSVPPEQIFQALQTVAETDDHKDSPLGQLAAAKAAYYENAKIDLGDGGRVTHLFPNEDFSFNSVKAPHDNYDTFSKGLLREISRCIPMTFEDFSGDYSSATYSSVRIAVATHWPVFVYRRKHIAAPFCQAIYSAWLEEEIFEDRIGYPGGFEAFVAQRAAATAATWRGPAKPTADDLKTTNAAIARLSNGLSTYQTEIADATGEDWEDVFEQRAREQAKAKKLGLVFTGEMAPVPGTEDDTQDKPVKRKPGEDDNGR